MIVGGMSESIVNKKNVLLILYHRHIQIGQFIPVNHYIKNLCFKAYFGYGNVVYVFG